MARYILPAFMTALLIAILVAINLGTRSLAEWMGFEFTLGVLTGLAFCAALYYLIRWLEPSGPNR